MILILGGTSDAREVAQQIRAAGYPVLVTVVSGYAAELAQDIGEVRVGALTEASFAVLLEQAQAVVDATHPFATAVSRLAIDGCQAHGVPYLRYERPEAALPDNVLLAVDAEEAAQMAVNAARGGTMFLTVGSKTLATYVPVARDAGCRVVARVLPTADSLAACAQCGLTPRDIIAMQGPTTTELDIALLRYLHADVLVTKESGPAGGVADKVAAATAAGIPAIVVGRPQLTYPRVARTPDDIMSFLATISG